MERARAGEGQALETLRETGHFLGRGLRHGRQGPGPATHLRRRDHRGLGPPRADGPRDPARGRGDPRDRRDGDPHRPARGASPSAGRRGADPRARLRRGGRLLKPAAVALAAALVAAGAAAATAPIDRRALVDRHRPVLRAFDTESPLSVGNGELAFTADATGLQTFAEAYDETIPLGTLSQWGWHTAPNPARLDDRALPLHRTRLARARDRLRGHPGRPTDAGDRVAARQPAPAAPRPHRLPPRARRRTRGDPGRPHRRRAGARPVGRLAPQPLPSRRGGGHGGDALPPAPGPRRGAGRLAPRPAGAHRDPPALPLWHGRCDRGGLDAAGGARDGARALERERRGARAPPRRRPLLRAARLEPRRPSRGGGEARLPPRVVRGERALRGRGRLLSRPARGAAPLVRGDAPGHARALEPLLVDRRGRRSLREPRPPRGRAGAAHRPLAVPHRHPVRRPVPAAGDGPHLQQLGRQVPPGDALVARRALRPVGPARAPGAQPRVLRRDPAARRATAATPGVLRAPAGPR